MARYANHRVTSSSFRSNQEYNKCSSPVILGRWYSSDMRPLQTAPSTCWSLPVMLNAYSGCRARTTFSPEPTVLSAFCWDMGLRAWILFIVSGAGASHAEELSSIMIGRLETRIEGLPLMCLTFILSATELASVSAIGSGGYFLACTSSSETLQLESHQSSFK